MTWTAGLDITTGDLVTAAQWNSYLGTTGSMEYLQSWAQNDVTASRAIDGTVYQNTKDWILVVQINVRLLTIDTGTTQVEVKCGSANPPTTIIGILRNDFSPIDADDSVIGVSITLVVLPGYYYKATETNTGSGNATLLDWFEWGPA